MTKQSSIEDIQRLGGRLSLDFVNTVHRRPAAPSDEYLRQFRDFLTWASLAGMLDGDAARALDVRAGQRGDVLLAEILGVRELIHRIFEATVENGAPADEDLQAFETLVREARSRQRLQFEGRHARWIHELPNDPASTLLDPILSDAEELLTSVRLDRVKQCEPGEGCGWLFFDATKNRSRRWCSMETCGSPAKARAWYRRQKQKGK